MATIGTLDTGSPNHAVGAVVDLLKPTRAQPGNRTIIPVIEETGSGAGGTTGHPIIG